MNHSISGERKMGSHPGVAAVLSFLYSGLGQLYNGQIKKGLAIISFSSLGIVLTVMGAILVGHYLLTKVALRLELIWGVMLLLTGILLICCIGLYSIFDAYNTAIGRLKE
jgi:TM2 domain-containing membrane protein YozV